jgi:hypothetical protein
MGRAVQVFVFDDPTFAETGEKVQAERLAIPLGFDGADVVLDLTKAHYDELAALVQPWIMAGKRASAPPEGKRSRGRQPAEYYEGMRAYAKEKGVKIPTDGEGKFSYPEKLRRDYEAAVAEGWPGG